MQTKTVSEQTDLLALSLCVIALLVFLLPVIILGIDNVQLIAAFELDEADAAMRVSRMIVDHSLSTGGFFNHGAVYFHLSAFLAFPFALLFPEASETIAIVALRAICLLSAIGTLIVVYLFAKKVFDRQTARLAPLIMLVSPNFLHWSITAHPDMLQMLFILISLHYVCQMVLTSKKQSCLVWASLFAGLSFGTKYAGLFLLPIILLGVMFAELSASAFRSLAPRQSIAHLRWPFLSILWRCLLVSFIFMVTFVSTNPYALVNYDEFRKDIAFEQQHIAEGHLFYADDGGLLWFRVIGGQPFLGTVGALFLGIGLVVWVRHLYRSRGYQPSKLSGVLILAWIATYLGYLVLCVNFRPTRFLFPILPFLAMLSAYGLLTPLRMREHLGAYGWLALVVSGAFIVATIGPQAVEAYEHRESLASKMGSPAAKVGAWLSENVSSDSRILYDPYVYMPQVFENAVPGWGLNWGAVFSVWPEIIVVNQGFAETFSDPTKAEQWQAGTENYLASRSFYASLSPRSQHMLSPKDRSRRGCGV